MTPTVESNQSPIQAQPAAPAVDRAPSLNRGDRNLNPSGIGFLSLLCEDLRIHDNHFCEQGFWAIAVHRFGNWRMDLPKPIRVPMTILYRFLYKWVEWTCGISLPYTVGLGRRVRIWHHGGMILHARSIGDDVTIRQNTTFGLVSPDRPLEIPTIENQVDIGCGACVLGNVTIGHGSRIGANAVVLSDIPAGSTAVGVPARVIERITERDES